MKIITAICINGLDYTIRQTNSPSERWVQTEKGERIAVFVGGAWKWKEMKP